MAFKWKWQSWCGASSRAARWKWLEEAWECWEFFPGVYKTFLESFWSEKTSKIPNSNPLSGTAPVPWNYSSFHFRSTPSETILEFLTVSCFGIIQQSLMFSRLEVGWSRVREPSQAPFAPLHPSGSWGAVFQGIREAPWELAGLQRLCRGGIRAGAGGRPVLEPSRARGFHYGRKWGQAQPLCTGIVCCKGCPGDFLFFLEAFLGWECPWKTLPPFEYGNTTVLLRLLNYSRAHLRAHFYNMDWVYLV